MPEHAKQNIKKYSINMKEGRRKSRWDKQKTSKKLDLSQPF